VNNFVSQSYSHYRVLIEESQEAISSLKQSLIEREIDVVALREGKSRWRQAYEDLLAE
jgi:hypothetical protein